MPADAATASNKSAGDSQLAPQKRTDQPEPSVVPAGARRRFERLKGRRPWVVAGVLVTVPTVAAGITIAALPGSTAAATTPVKITSTDCAKNWKNPHSGNQRFEVTNSSGAAGEIKLVNAAGGIAGEIETIGPATTATMSVALAPGSSSSGA